MTCNRSIPIRLYATQHTDRETSLPQGTDAHIFNDLHSKVSNATPVEEIIFLNTNVNTHQSTNTLKCKHQLKVTKSSHKMKILHA